MKYSMTSNSDMKNMDIKALIDQFDMGDTHNVRTRFAPSPNGYLHQGHALSTLLNQQFAYHYDGSFMLRIEDIDATRSRPEFCDSIVADLRWLGLDWDGEIIYQSSRINTYRTAFNTLKEQGLLYPCFCSRSDIANALAGNPVQHGPDGPHYPGTCRDLKNSEERIENEPHAWRLDMAKTLHDLPFLAWNDMGHGEQIADASIFGDIVIWRKDAPASYHLAATCDDAADAISHVIRGMDLFAYSAVHRLLQHLLNLPTPQYWHHGLLTDTDGEKLSKSRDSISLMQMRESGASPKEILTFIEYYQINTGIS